MTPAGILGRILSAAGLAAALAATPALSYAADSVDVVFRHNIPTTGTTYYVPGEFNGWVNTSMPMSFQGSYWARTVRLPVGGKAGGGVPGGFQYKFWYGPSQPGTWFNDPLNHHINAADNSNSVVYVKDPTVYQFLPNTRQGTIATSTPVIQAYVFPKVGAGIDTSGFVLTLDGVPQSNVAASFDRNTNHLSYPLSSPIPNGAHTVILTAKSSAGGTNSDTVTFYSAAGFVQVTSHGNYTTHAAQKTVYGTVLDSTVTSVQLVRNGTDSITAGVSSKKFSGLMTLVEGANSIVAVADSHGVRKVSSPFAVTRYVNHAPAAAASASLLGAQVTLSSEGTSDPDTQAVTVRWLDDPATPLGLNGATGASVSVPLPAAPGEYYFALIATDPDNHADTLRSYFIVNADSTLSNPTIASNPAWAKSARIYFLFPKAASASGTLTAAALRLPYIKQMGFSVVWVMPVMKNAYPIDQHYGPGYNITDFYSVAPEYGTNADFKSFVSQAHAIGLKVILDVTPNHTSRFHPWSTDAHQFRQDSPYWTWYEHAIIPHNDNGLGQSLDADGFNYYSGFGDQLLNYNWKDPDAQAEMINVYATWITQFGLDGYRFDVYWGPHRRYGEAYMGDPVRRALKHIKPDILLLAEDNATGAGTETIFADYASGNVHGGVDMAYDFGTYFNQIRSFSFSSAASAITSLNSALDNGGYYPGVNSLFMRFMESQDEDRITAFYSNFTNSGSWTYDATTTFKRTMPMASVVFTAPGVPMLYNGQEVGWGYGLAGAKEDRNRSTINWEYQGKQLLSPHYQKLALLRGQFPAFTQHKQDSNLDGAVNGSDASDFVRVGSSNALVYAFSRPYPDQNGLTVANFSAADQSASINLAAAGVLKFGGGISGGTDYYLNNLYDGTYQTVAGSSLGSVNVTLPAFGTAVYTVSLTRDSLVITNPVTSVDLPPVELPLSASLDQNYPNPFNPTTTIVYQVGIGAGPNDGSSVGRVEGRTTVRLVVYDLLGREVATLVNESQSPGKHAVTWNASGVATGAYFYRLTAGSFVATKKLLLLR
jgi:cyclomaltodextrinase / maltogenic alpha-amylase / neopullulanase